MKWNGGDLKICVQYSHFCMKYIGENATYRTKAWFLNITNLWNFEKFINDIYMGIVFILVRK